MTWFQRLFRKKMNCGKSDSTKLTGAAASTKSDANPQLIRVYAGNGQEMLISRETWRTRVLPDSLKKAWNDPDQLYTHVHLAANDGFFVDILQAANRLHEIDHDRARSTCILGIVLMKQNRLDAAEKLYRDFITTHGDVGVILTNLAKVYAEQNKNVQAEETLWHALEVDPNQDNGLIWYQAIRGEHGGEEERRAAFRRVAHLPGSWRAQLWLARSSLEANQLEQAIALYQESLSHAERPVPTDLLVQMSGDLGNHGYLNQSLLLTEHVFDARHHGLRVGNNLIKAHLDLGQIDAATRIVEELQKLKRPDWKQHLDFWEKEIHQARTKA